MVTWECCHQQGPPCSMPLLLRATVYQTMVIFIQAWALVRGVLKNRTKTSIYRCGELWHLVRNRKLNLVYSNYNSSETPCFPCFLEQHSAWCPHLLFLPFFCYFERVERHDVKQNLKKTNQKDTGLDAWWIFRKARQSWKTKHKPPFFSSIVLTNNTVPRFHQ